MNEVYRVLQAGGTFEVYVPRLFSTFVSRSDSSVNGTFRSIEYFTDGKFAWYFDDQPFDFELVHREVNLWVHLSGFSVAYGQRSYNYYIDY